MKMIYTIGHSTRALDEFIAILDHYGIKMLADIRTMPRSRHVPQFNEENMAEALPKAGISYAHFKDLGGLRPTSAASLNMGWRNKSFRGYADHMQTRIFARGLEKLIQIAHNKCTAIMCAEVLPWRCHRSLVGDALLVRGYTVIDIFDSNTTKHESITNFAKVDGYTITYPKEHTEQLL